MKTLLLILSLALASPQTTNVYICNSKSAEVYHAKKNCKGLQKCTHEVKEISVESAVKLGRRKCKVCY